MALRLNGSNTGYVELDVPADAGSHTLTLPDSGGSSGQYLQTNGSGALSWVTPAGGKILQVVQTYKTDTFSSATTGQYDLLTRTITPQAAGSSFLLMGKLNVGNGSGQNSGWTFRWLLGTTHITAGSGDAAGNRNTGWSGTEEGISDATRGQYQTYDANSQFIHTPTYTLGDTLTYKIAVNLIASGSNTFFLNRTSADNDSSQYPRNTSNLTIMEIAA